MPEEKAERLQPIEPGAEKKALGTADAQAARNASAADVNEVQSTNPNKFESMTKLPTIKDGKSLTDTEAEYQSFGIRMNDGTAVTGAGTEAPAGIRKVSVDPRPSFVEGLMAFGNDEEAQGRFSIEYMERKAKEALAALQEKPAEQVLIASNITPTVPNLEQMQQYEDVQSDTLAPGAVTAWDPKEVLEKSVYPHRDSRESFVDHDAARSASQRFSRLAAYSERHEGIGPRLIAAILQNEQTYYRSDKDGIPDAVVRQTGEVGFDVTIGPAQMKVSNIKYLAQKYPEILGSVKDSTHLATDKWYATMLVGAYLDDKIQTFETWSKKPPEPSTFSKDERYQFDHALPLWKAGMETKALAMSYNPAGGKEHLKNVLKYLD